MAKCNLGKINLRSMVPAVFPLNTVCLQVGCRALPCHVLMNQPYNAIYPCFAIIVVCSTLFCKQSYYPALPTLVGSHCIRLVFPLKFLQCDGVGWWPLAGLVPAHRVAMKTSPLCLIIVQGPHQPFLAPVPKLIYWQ
mgnify:CR=1 FL=1